MDTLSWQVKCNLTGGLEEVFNVGRRIIAAWQELYRENENRGILGEQRCQVEVPEYLLTAFEDSGMERLVSFLNDCYSGRGAPSAVFDDSTRRILISWVQ